MSSNAVVVDGDPAWAFFDAIDAALTGLFGTDPCRRSTAQQKRFLRRAEQIFNRIPALGHREIAALRQTATAAELGDTLQRALAEILRISRSEAKRRVDDAENLGPRTALSGEPMTPWLAATAKAQAEGAIGAGHVEVIREFFKELPGHVGQQDRDDAEATLAAAARTKRPDELKKDAQDLFLQLDQDGACPEDRPPRAPEGEIRISPQRRDGTSKITGTLTAEARATLEPVFAKWAAPGACNPADESPCVDQVTEEAAGRDGRTQPQRNHDALVAVGRAMLASGQLGKHHGLPATIIVSTTLADLEAKAGLGVTAGGTRLPVADVLRLARHASHYLAIYGDHGEVLHLGRTRRTATPAQQIVLYGRDRGCTRPGCTVPGYGCEAHHAVLDWANGGLTNIDDLAFACPKDNKLVKEGGWTTRKNLFGDTEWIPPPHLDVGQPRVNDFHHPQRLRPRHRAVQPWTAPELTQKAATDPAPLHGDKRPGLEDQDGPVP